MSSAILGADGVSFGEDKEGIYDEDDTDDEIIHWCWWCWIEGAGDDIIELLSFLFASFKESTMDDEEEEEEAE